MIPLFDIQSFRKTNVEGAKKLLVDAGYEFWETADYVTEETAAEAVNEVFGIDPAGPVVFSAHDDKYYMITVQLDRGDYDGASLPSLGTDFNEVIDELISASGLPAPALRGSIDSEYADEMYGPYGAETLHSSWTNYYAIGTVKIDDTESLWAICIPTCTNASSTNFSTTAEKAYLYCGDAKANEPAYILERLEFWSQQQNQGIKPDFFHATSRGDYMDLVLHWFEKDMDL